MTASRRAPSRLSAILAAAALAFAAAVTFWRGALLARGIAIPTATGEERFYLWAWRDPAVNAALARIAPSLAYGETVCLAEPVRNHDPGWLRIMATYELARQIVIVPADAERARSAPACRRTLLLLGADGTLRLERAARGASP